MKKKELIIRLLKDVKFSVFCVDDDQKKYYDKSFGVLQPYSSGQQIKKCVIDAMLDVMDEDHAPITFNHEIAIDKLKQKEITQLCDPSYIDQLIGGWMSSPSKKGGKTEKNDDDKTTYKRRSPLSISAMSPVHPLLASLVKEPKMTFDRTSISNDNDIIRDDKGKEVDIQDFLNKSNAKISHRNLISSKDRANGYFDCIFTIDLGRLFRVDINTNKISRDVELSDDTISKLKENDWLEIDDRFGKHLELPKQYHKDYAEAIAYAIVNWKITSNQSRTHDLMPTLSIAISSNANEIANVFRGELEFENGKNKANLIVDNNYKNTTIYSNKNLNSYIIGAETSYTANDDAVEHIKNVILEYYSDNN